MTRQLELTTRAWVEVDLGALRRNGTALVARSGVPLLPMIKADAYGLGAAPVARALSSLEPWGFGVATVAEGAQLRDSGIDCPVVVFSSLLPEDLEAVRDLRLTPTLTDPESVIRWGAEGGGPWHLAIDTGMSRSGVAWGAVADMRELLLAQASPPQGAFTHYHSAELNDESYEVQTQRFVIAVQALPRRPPLLHAENSAAIVRHAPSRWDLVRPGIFLYGVGSGPGAALQPEPVVRLRARVLELRSIEDGETVSYGASYRAVDRRRIATLGIGYGDGYRRSLGNRGSALLHGRRAAVAGVVTMDMTMLDVTDVPCEVGDIATLIGSEGASSLDVETVARTAELSPYELLTGLRGRLPRLYVDGAS